jgi:hypothetical protein
MGRIEPAPAILLLHAAQAIGGTALLQPRQIGRVSEAVQGAHIRPWERGTRVVPHHDRPRDHDPGAPGARLASGEDHRTLPPVTGQAREERAHLSIRHAHAPCPAVPHACDAAHPVAFSLAPRRHL